MATSFNLGGLLGSAFGGGSNALDEFLTPEQRAAMRQQAGLAAAAALLQAAGPSTTRTSLGQALGSALTAGQGGYQRAQESALSQMLTRQKLEEAKAEQERDRRFRETLTGLSAGATAPDMGPAAAPAMTPEQALSAPGMPAGPTVQRAALIGQPSPVSAAPQGAPQLSAQQLALISTLPRKEAAAKLVDLLQPPKPETDPEKVRTLRLLGLPVTIENLRQLDKPEASPAEVRILEATGTPVTLQNVMNLRRSGATQVDVRMPGNQQFLGGVGTNIAETLGGLTSQARAATDTLSTIERIRPALGSAVTGPAAEYRTTMLRIGQQLGVSGTNESERLTNTRTLVQGLAQLELDAAAGMRGQGALTEGERAILRRAAAGDQTLSAPELVAAMDAAEKIAKRRIEIQQQYLQQASKLPGFQQFAPMYQIPGGGSAGMPALNSIDAEIQRRQQQQQQPRGR